MTETKPKVTKAMMEVINRMLNGAIITHNDRNFVVGSYSDDMKVIRWDVWAKLKVAGIIYQEGYPNFEYVLDHKIVNKLLSHE